MRTQNNEFDQLWQRILDDVKERINDEKNFSAFLSDSKLYKLDNNVLYVVVNSLLAKQILSSGEYHNLIIESIINCTESNYSVAFICENEINTKKINTNEVTTLFQNCCLKKEMNFNNFVVGNSNKEAYQAALIASSDKSIKLFNANPLFIYSNSGLGKTHLLHSIGNAIKDNNFHKKILYTTAEDFFNEYIHIVNGDSVNQQLLDYFRNIDVLLIDDIQFFVDKKKSQDLFFTIFSSLINNNKQVVVTSDKSPNELKGIENRLISRFEGGLTVSINPPEIETSIKIIKLHVVSSGLDISRIDNDVFTFFAENFSKNIRELRGAINKLLFYTINIKGVEHITLSNAMEAVGGYLKNNNNKLNEIKIIDIVSNYYSLTPSQLTGNIRTSQIVLARHIAMYLIRELLDIPFKQIGNIFGGKDHSTVMSAVKNVEKNIKNNPSLQTVVNELKNKLK